MAADKPYIAPPPGLRVGNGRHLTRTTRNDTSLIEEQRKDLLRRELSEEEKKTLLHYLQQPDQDESAKKLLETASYDYLNQTIFNNENILNYAAQFQQWQIVEYLVFERGMNPAELDNQKGWNVLHYAAFYDEARIITKLLQSQKVTYDSKTRDNLTALDIAENKPFLAANEHLIKKNKDTLYNKSNYKTNARSALLKFMPPNEIPKELSESSCSHACQRGRSASSPFPSTKSRKTSIPKLFKSVTDCSPRK